MEIGLIKGGMWITFCQGEGGTSLSSRLNGCSVVSPNSNNTLLQFDKNNHLILTSTLVKDIAMFCK